MALNELWTFDAFQSDSALPRPVWVERRHLGGGGVDVAVRLRSNASGELVEPEANVTVRIRWRGDVSALARLVDPTGRLWFVNGYVEVGRHQWIDLSLSAFGLLLSGGADSPAPSPPAGWQLQSAGGVWVDSLVIRRFFDERQHPVNDGNSANYWAFTVTALSAWQLAGDFEAGPIRPGFLSASAGVRCC